MGLQKTAAKCQLGLSINTEYVIQRQNVSFLKCVSLCSQNSNCNSVFLHLETCYGSNFLTPDSTKNSDILVYSKRPKNGMYFVLQIRIASMSILQDWVRVRVMEFNVTFNNILSISWQSVLLVEEPEEHYRLAASHWQTASHNAVSSTLCMSGIRTHNVSGWGYLLH